MIISYKKKFVFLHCRKTAGTYVSFLLYDFLSNRDLIIGSLEDINKIKKLKLSNHQDIFKLTNFTDVLISLLKTFNKKKNLGFFLNDFYKKKFNYISKNPPHMSIAQIHENFPETRNFFSFCFVRNPYDYEVSDYLWRLKNYKEFKDMKFRDFLRLKLLNEKHKIIPQPKTNWDIYTKNDKISVDFVGKFENINRDLKIIFSHLGYRSFDFIEKNLNLKKNYSRKSYRDYYSSDEKNIVEKLHFKEIQEFKYNF